MLAWVQELQVALWVMKVISTIESTTTLAMDTARISFMAELTTPRQQISLTLTLAALVVGWDLAALEVLVILGPQLVRVLDLQAMVAIPEQVITDITTMASDLLLA